MYAIANSPVVSLANVINIDRRPKPVPSNYTARGKRKATPGDPFRELSDIQLFKNYFHEHSLRNYALFVLGISIGIRGKDLLRLQVRDVVTNDGFVADEISTFESKTHKMNHPIINAEAKAAIAEYLSSLSIVHPDDYLFRASSDENKPLETNSLRRLLVRAKEALAPQLSCNFSLNVRSLRKTFAYWIIVQHYDDPHVMASLQEMLNHDSMLTTLHYSGHTRDHLSVMYQDMGNVVAGTATRALPQTESVEAMLEKLLDALKLDAE